jgi:uncharacterized phage protein (TIGR01671 family)
MREIKFRVWDGTLMLPAESIQFDTETVEVLIPCDAFGCEGHPIEYDFGNVVLMQYTGLCDKNGKEIYEGDIVRLYCKGTEHLEGAHVVEWISESEGGFSIGWGLFNNTFDYEVIGNIYENPDLLAEVSE